MPKERALSSWFCFGSQAVGNVANGSRFDIAVSFKDGKSIFDDLVKYSEMLENFQKYFCRR